MMQTNASPNDLSPEDAERFAASFRPSWELDEPSLPADPLTTKALDATMPLGAASPMSDAPKTVESTPDAGSKRQKTLVMAGAPGRTDASAPLPSFDLPVSAPKLPPSPVSESDVAKTSVYKQVNAADIVLPDDDIVAPKKTNKNLFIGVGIAGAVALAAAMAFGMSSGSGDTPKASPSADLAPPKPTVDVPPPPPATAEATAAPIPGMNEPKGQTKAAAEPPKPAKPEAAPLKPPAAAALKPPAPTQPAAAQPAAPAPAKPAGKPGGGIVRDAPF